MNTLSTKNASLPGRLLLTVLLWIGWLAQGSAADVTVIVNKDNPTTAMEPARVSDLYLGRSRVFPNGEPAHVLEQPRDSLLREQFFRRVNGMSLNQVNTYWARLTFSGRVLPPVVQKDSAAARTAVEADAKAIGYVDEGTLPPSVSPVLGLHE
ncbi:MAG: hypothetical protein HQL87_16715 [Magnetococcales bacterium]|nr:hypothetical protein [Magnetococcales bacterium]